MLHGHDSLTTQETEIARHADFDLGPGYPQLPVGPQIRSLYTDPAILEYSLQVAPQATRADQLLIDEAIEDALVGFLGIHPSTYSSISTTFSGGIALDRSIAGMLRMARVSDIERTNVITTSPSIDIMKFLLEERTSQVKRHFVEAADELVGTLDPDPIIERIALVRRRSARDGLIVLLTSPENPTGAIWSRTALQAISASCCDHDGTLIVDHAFLTAGVHDAKCVPAIWDNAVDGSDWIAIWDTGKTFGLNEDKLGFLVASSSRVSSSIRFALNVVQFDVPRRQKLLFAKILRSPFAWTHAAELRAACRENVSIAEELSWGNALEVLPVAAGSLGLLRLEEHQIDELVRVRLLQAGIGVVSGSVFFHGVRRPTSFLRVALARTPSYFQEAFARLVATL